MRTPIYYSKFIFNTTGLDNYRLIGNIPYKELYIEEYKNVPQYFRGKILYKEIITGQRGIKLTDDDIEAMKPYMNAWDFEPYLNRKMSMSDEGFIWYLDWLWREFYGFTDSPIPYIKLPMDYGYRNPWPSQVLFDYIYKTFIKTDRLASGHTPADLCLAAL